MANDLNFDELDQAVNTYMQQRTPASGPTPAAAVKAPESSPINPSVAPAPAPAATASAAPTPTAAQHVQVRPRQTIAPGNRTSHTFHDIVSPRKTLTPKRLTPMNDVTSPLHPETAPKPSDVLSPASSAATPSPISDMVAPKTSPVPDTSTVSLPAPELPEPPMATSQADLIKTTPELTPPAPISPPAATTEPTVPQVLNDDLEPTPTPTVTPPKKGAFDDISEALREDLKKVNQVNDDEDEEAPTTAAPTTAEPTPPEETITKPDTKEPHYVIKEGFPTAPDQEAAKNPSVLSQSGPTAHEGLLDPDDAIPPIASAPHEPLLPDSEHLLPAGDEVQKPPMQLFDTTEYHTPIAGKTSAASLSTNNRIIGLIVVIVGIVVVIAAGVAVYMFYIKK